MTPPNYTRRIVKIPFMEIAMLAQTGIGALMFVDAIDRVTRIASEVGGIGLVVNAKPPAVDFY